MPPELLGGVFPKGRVSIIHSLPGSGKSHSTIKCLNGVGIIPVYIDLDTTTGIEDLMLYRVSNELFFHMLEDEGTLGLEGKVVIIDTYSRVHEDMINAGYTNKAILLTFESMCIRHGITVIVIAHTHNYATSNGIFDDNTDLLRGLAEECFLEKSLYKAKAGTKANPKGEDAKITYTLHVRKGRGNGGTRTVDNWMRGTVEHTVTDEDKKVYEEYLLNIDQDKVEIDLMSELQKRGT